MTWQDEVTAKGVESIRPLAKGKRSIVYEGKLDGVVVIIKTKHPDSETPARMEIEAQWLHTLNTHNIGPQLLFSGKEYLVYKKVEGTLIVEYVTNASLENSVKMLCSLFETMFTLDQLGINKEEMHHPVKHVYIKDHTPYLIDFERCNRSFHPQNVTQLCQFVTGSKLTHILESKGLTINKARAIHAAQLYKEALRSFFKEETQETLITKYKELLQSLNLHPQK